VFIYVYFVFLLHTAYVLYYCEHGGMDLIGLSLILRTYLPSVLWHCWFALFTHENLSLIWPVMCLVAH